MRKSLDRVRVGFVRAGHISDLHALEYSVRDFVNALRTAGEPLLAAHRGREVLRLRMNEVGTAQNGRSA